MTTLWGLKNCDTCKKARAWLEAKGVDHSFKDVRADGVGPDEISQWLDAVGADVLINRRGTTWRGLGDADKARAETTDTAIPLLVEHPALIKRPVFLLGDGSVVVGFAKAEQAALDARL